MRTLWKVFGAWRGAFILAAAAVACYSAGEIMASILCGGVTVAHVWSYGIMHNFRHDPDATPVAWLTLNLITTFLALSTVVYGLWLLI